MLNDVIARLRLENQLAYFTDKFQSMQDALISEMRSGSVKSLEQLASHNGKLELLEGLKNLDKMKF